MWLSVAPGDVLPQLSTDAQVVPVGAGNAYAIACGSGAPPAALLHGEYKWVAPRDLLGLPMQGRASQAEVEAVVRAVALLSWHGAHAFSGKDGAPTLPSENPKRRKLASGRSLYPRIDPVAIVLVESADGERCLLGRQIRYPKGMFTCISGFVELGESAERAAAREVLEETNVKVEAVSLVASQPWPCGRGNSCELMLGCIARAAPSGEAIDVAAHVGEGGGELEAARWFDRAQAKLMLERAVFKLKDGGENVPPPLAIAYHLVKRWCEGELRVAVSEL